MSGHARSSRSEKNDSGNRSQKRSLEIDRTKTEDEGRDSEPCRKKRQSVFERLSTSSSRDQHYHDTVSEKNPNLTSTTNHKWDRYSNNGQELICNDRKRFLTDDDSEVNQKHKSEKGELDSGQSVFQRLEKNTIGSDEKNPSPISHRMASSSRNHSRSHVPDRPRNFLSQFPKPVVHCCGDSFVGTLSLIDSRVLAVQKFKGASAKGLNNALSTLRIGEKLLKILTEKKPKNVLLIFGNVDFHMNFMYQLQTKKELALGPDEFMNQVFDNYTKFLQSKILGEMVEGNEEDGKCFIEKLLISSVIHPIVRDQYLSLSIQKYTESEAIANGDANVTRISIDELLKSDQRCDFQSRLNMVLQFNEKLKDWCSKHPKVGWIDVNKYIIEPSTNEVKQEFCDKDPTNVHILWEQTIEFWLKEIQNQDIHGIDVTHITVDLKKSADAYRIEKRERMKKHPITSVLLNDKSSSVIHHH